MRVLVKNVRLSFADIWNAKEFMGKTKFSANGICSDETTLQVEKDGKKISLPHSDFDKVINSVCKDKWGKTPAKLKQWAYCPADGSGTRDKYVNSDGDYHDGYDEDTFFVAANKLESQAPGGITIVDQKRMPLKREDGKPVSGDYVNLLIEVYGYESENDKGITASLEGIQYLRKGEPFGNSGPASADAFDEEELVDEDEVNDEDVDDLI